MINIVIFFALGILYMMLKIYLERRLALQDATAIERRLADLAFASGCSEYELFKRSAEKWRFSNQKIERDFRRYLKTGHLPTYMNQLLAEHAGDADSTYQQLIFSGGRPPYL